MVVDPQDADRPCGARRAVRRMGVVEKVRRKGGHHLKRGFLFPFLRGGEG